MFRRIASCLLLLLFSISLSAQKVLIKTHFDTTNIPPTPNYAEASCWESLPFIKDFADSTPPGLQEDQDNAKADVFFIIPTTYTDKPDDQYRWNADVHNEHLNRKTQGSTILYQASIFNASCRIYAPRYRQAHYSCFLTGDTADKRKALELAYSDVKAAFEYYLLHYNNHRPIVIASHSQGTIHAVKLLQEFFVGKPLQNQLVVAYLVGMPVPVDSLPTIQPCRDSLQTNCFNCWNSFEKKYIPRYYSKGLVSSVCTNPLSWNTLESYVPAAYNKGAVVRPFSKIYPKLSDAQVHQGLLWVTKPVFPGSFLIRTSIYHAGDYNFYYLNIRENVAVRIREFLKQER